MKPIILVIAILFISSCKNEPSPIVYGVDACQYCKMTIIDKKFGAELMNRNGKTLKFDSGECMINYMIEDKKFQAAKMLIVDFADPGKLMDVENSFFVHGGLVNSPMGGRLASFKTKAEAEKYQKELLGDILSWSSVTQLDFR